MFSFERELYKPPNNTTIKMRVESLFWKSLVDLYKGLFGIQLFKIAYKPLTGIIRGFG